MTTLGLVGGIWHAEDVVRVPGTRWLVGSGMIGPERPVGALHLVDTAARTARVVVPALGPARAPHDGLDAPDLGLLNAHGLALRPGAGGVHELLLVNHGGREAIEVLELDARGDVPALTWTGAVAMPPRTQGNAVAPLAGGGLVATNYLDPEDPAAVDDLQAGRVTGDLREWHPGRGWSVVPGSALAGPNGVDVSPDGRWLFVGCWAARELVRLSRGAEPVRRDTVPIDCLPDNVKWSPEGTLLVAGQASDPYTVTRDAATTAIGTHGVVVLEWDPETLAVTELVREQHDHFGMAATALRVDGELWISSARNDSVAYVTG